MEHRMKEMAAEAERVSRKEKREKEIRRCAYQSTPTIKLGTTIFAYPNV